MANKTISYKNRIRLREDQSEYVFRLRRNNKWLWWRLLLLPLLLLFIKCERDIDVSTINSTTGDAVPHTEVSIDYTSYYLLNNGRFFYREKIHKDIETDDHGNGTFKDLQCSVFSYIFHAFSKAYYTAKSQCYTLTDSPEKSLFHYKWHKVLKLNDASTDIELLVVDDETNEVLAGSTIVYGYSIDEKSFTDSVTTSANGKCVIKGAPLCDYVNIKKVSCYGYADTTNINLKVESIINYPDSAIIRMRPLKLRFTYFVKNKYTREPVPGAVAEVILTTNGGNVIRGKSVTNVDGKGFGAYKDAFVLADIQIKASKLHYKDGRLEGQYNVEQFVLLPDSSRVIYLEPEPYMEQFKNVDSITGMPIAGVNNSVLIDGINGEQTKLNEISNRNGVFYVKANEGDKIDIHSELSPFYEIKHTYIKSFDKGEIIKMKPILTDVVFRTIEGETGEILPDCSLKIFATISGVNTPTNSGDGNFIVNNVRLDEKISIVASKKGFTTNSDKIRNENIIDLVYANQEKRDIPLFIALPPCDAGSNGESDLKAGTVSIPKSYNMGTNSGVFDITYETGSSCPDCIDIYNHKPSENYKLGSLIFTTGQVATDGEKTSIVRFDKGSVITVVVTTGDQDGSIWEYHISCPY